MHKSVSILRSRLPALIGFAAIALALCIGIHIRGNLTDAWKTLGVPALSPLFADTRTVTHSIDCLLSGQNPYTVRSFDPWHRAYNYPPIWLDLRYLGVTSRTSNLLGTLFAAMTASTLLLLFRARTWTAVAIIFFAVTSRSVLFAVERGNTDEVIFFLLAFGFFLADYTKIKARPFLKGALIVCLSILKIFPIAAVIALIRNRRGLWAALVTAVLSAIAVVLTTGHQLAMIQANTPSDVGLSFGSLLFFQAIFRHSYHPLAAMMQQHLQLSVIAGLVLSVLSLVAGIIFREDLNQFFPPIDFSHPMGSIAVAGLAIYWLAFVRGASYDYRLIFLLGAVAYLVEEINQSKSLRCLPAATFLLVILWKPPNFNAIYEMFDGLVFALVSAWIGTSLLDHLRLPPPQRKTFDSD
jgi:hypothetical protein